MINIFFLKKECLSDFIKKIRLSYLPLPMKNDGDEVHLVNTMEWLMRAYENGRGGVSSHYSLISGKWQNPFPETTGYIIPTFYEYAAHSGDDRYFKVAENLAYWLLHVQLPDGSCMQGLFDTKRIERRPIVFNTGQNIFGFLHAFKKTGKEEFLKAAIKAGDFLINNIDGNGIWYTCLHHNIPHTYNSRTAWALLELHQVVSNDDYREIALSNLNWIVSQQTENGWFKHANFKPDELPNTHGIAYTIRGLLESYLITQDPKYLNSALKTANVFVELFQERKFLYTFWDESWRNKAKYFKRMTGKYSCLTGNIQLAIVWMKLYEITSDTFYLDSAFKMIDFIKTLQNIKTRKNGIKGGIKGAFPVYGSYSFLKYPNWAAKFFADALMMKTHISKKR